MHAERDIVLAIPSVCATSAGIVCKRTPHNVTLFDNLVEASL